MSRRPASSFLVEPFTFPRAGDSIVAELVAEASEIQSIQSPLYFQGGNILVADDRVLIGVDYLYETLETLTATTPCSACGRPWTGQGLRSRSLPETFDPERDFFFVGTRLRSPTSSRVP